MHLKKPFDRITVEPGKMGGKPCIRGYRISVEDVLFYLGKLPEPCRVARRVSRA